MAYNPNQSNENNNAENIKQLKNQTERIHQSVKEQAREAEKSRKGLMAAVKATTKSVEQGAKTSVKEEQASRKISEEQLKVQKQQVKQSQEANKLAKDEARRNKKQDAMTGIKNAFSGAGARFADAGKRLKPIVDSLGKVAEGLKRNWMDLLKGLIGALMLFDPQKFEEAVRGVVNGLTRLKEFFESEKFKNMMDKLWDFTKFIAAFSFDRLEQLLNGLGTLGESIDEFNKGNYWEALKKFGVGARDAAIGLAGLALILKPVGTLMLGFKALQIAVPAVGKSMTALAAIAAPLAAVPALFIGFVAGLEILKENVVHLARQFRNIYQGTGLGIDSLSNEQLLAEFDRTRRNIEAANSGPAGQLIDPDKDARLQLLLDEMRARGLDTQGYQQGGHVNVPGYGSGDKMPFMLPPGSFVMNRNAAAMYASGGLVPTLLEPGEKVFGPGSWGAAEMMMNDFIPRFQKGGIIEHLHGDPSRPGYDYHGHGTESNAHDHFAFSSVELRQAVQAELIARGYVIGSVNRPGDPGYHGSGQAFDVPWSQFGSGPINENDFARSRQLERDVKAILAQINGNGQGTPPPSMGTYTVGPYTYDAATGRPIAGPGITDGQGTPLSPFVPPGTGTSPQGPGSSPLSGLSFLAGTPFSGVMEAVITPMLQVLPALGGLLSGLGGLLFNPAQAANTPPPGTGMRPPSLPPSSTTGGGGGKKTKDQLIALARQAGFSDSQARTMAAIALAESGGDPGIDTKLSGLDPTGRNEYSIGLWQVNWNAHGDSLRARGLTPDDLRNPEINAREAFRIYSEAGGYTPWGAYTNGSYMQYMKHGGQVGGMNPAKSTSSSYYQAMSRGARNAGMYDANNPTVVVAGGGSGGGGNGGGSSQPMGLPPTLQSSPGMHVAADYLYRQSMGRLLA